MNDLDPTRPHVVPRIVRVAAGILGAAALGYTAWLATVFLTLIRDMTRTQGGAWPLPGLFLVGTIALAMAGGVALLIIAAGRRGGRRMLWITGGALVGLGILSGFSVGGAILPLGVAYLAAALVAAIRRPARIVAGAAVAVAMGAMAFVGTPMLGGLASIGAPELPVDRVVPQPGAVDVPLTIHIAVITKSLPSNNGTTQGLRVQYSDRGFAWLRPAVHGADGGMSSTDASGLVGPTRFTFAPTEALEACRTVGVTVIAAGYRPYRFAFRTACPYP